MSADVATLARRWFEEVWTRKSDDCVDELLDPACVGYMEGAGEIHGAEAFKAMRARLLDAFPDLVFHVEDILTQGNKAAARWTAHVTHRGAGLGLPPTSRRLELRGMTWLEFNAGRIVRGWDCWDHGGMVTRLSSPS